MALTSAVARRSSSCVTAACRTTVSASSRPRQVREMRFPASTVALGKSLWRPVIVFL
jgi:hypothetical protein